MFYFIDICNIKPVHLFSRGSISFPYLTWYKINGQLSGNNLMLIFVRLFPSKSKKANEKNQQFHLLDFVTLHGRKTHFTAFTGVGN